MANYMALSQNSWDYRFGDWEMLRLECRTPKHDKFYEMTYKANSIPGSTSWTARYGRIGSRGQRMTYAFQKFWNEKLEEKLKKGYKIVACVPATTTSTPLHLPMIHPNANQKYLDKINLVIGLLSDAGPIWNNSELNAPSLYKEVCELKVEYTKTGILRKKDMMRLNLLYNVARKNV